MPLPAADKERIKLACANNDLPQIITILKSHKGDYQHLDPFYIALEEVQSAAAILILKDYINKGKVTPEFINKSFFTKPHPFTDTMSPIHIACEMGNLTLLNLLLSIKGIDVNAKSTLGFTPILIAAKYDLPLLVERLLQVEGIKPDEANNAGGSPLHSACVFGYSEIAKLLLKKGKVDVNRITEFPEGKEHGVVPYLSVLMCAVAGVPQHCCDMEVIKLLVRAGASFTIMGQDIFDNIEIHDSIKAEAEPYIKRIKELRAAQGYEQTPELFQKKKELFEAIEAKDEAKQVETVKRIIAAYPMLLNALDEHSDAPKEGDSPLQRACRLGRPLIVDALLTAKDNVNKIKSGGNVTPLMMASQGGFVEVVKLLVIKGKASLDKENKFKDTALTIAADKKHVPVAKILIEAGANVHQVVDNGRSCLDIAQKCPEIAQMLSARGARTSAEMKSLQNGNKQPTVAVSMAPVSDARAAAQFSGVYRKEPIPSSTSTSTQVLPQRGLVLS